MSNDAHHLSFCPDGVGEYPRRPVFPLPQVMDAATRKSLSTRTPDDLVALSHLVGTALNDAVKVASKACKSPRGLEIGCWKGETTVWLLDKGIQHMTVVDPFTGSPELSCESEELRRAFDETVKGYKGRVTIHGEPSRRALPKLLLEGGGFDFVYVDGSHDSRDVILDAVLGFQLLRVGGVMVFDDYLWDYNEEAFRNPRPAIEFFVKAFAPDLLLLASGYQVAVQKL